MNPQSIWHMIDFDVGHWHMRQLPMFMTKGQSITRWSAGHQMQADWSTAAAATQVKSSPGACRARAFCCCCCGCCCCCCGWPNRLPPPKLPPALAPNRPPPKGAGWLWGWPNRLPPPPNGAGLPPNRFPPAGELWGCPKRFPPAGVLPKRPPPAPVWPKSDGEELAPKRLPLEGAKVKGLLWPPCAVSSLIPGWQRAAGRACQAVAEPRTSLPDETLHCWLAIRNCDPAMMHAGQAFSTLMGAKTSPKAESLDLSYNSCAAPAARVACYSPYAGLLLLSEASHPSKCNSDAENLFGVLPDPGRLL